MSVGCTGEVTFSRATGWFEKQAEKEAKNDTLKKSDRFGQVLGIVGVVICIIFFGYHLTMPTGFFTPAFGALDFVLFFGINIYGIIPPIIRFVTNHKIPARPFEILNSVLLLVALMYFAAKFPFDFSHLADPLPNPLAPLLSWISDGLASALMVLGVFGMLFAIPYQMLLYMAIRKLPPETKSQSSCCAQAQEMEEVKEGAK